MEREARGAPRDAPHRPPSSPPHSQHDTGDGDTDGHGALLKSGSDETAEGQCRHHAQREGEERVGAGQNGVHLRAGRSGPSSPLTGARARAPPPASFRPRRGQAAAAAAATAVPPPQEGRCDRETGGRSRNCRRRRDHRGACQRGKGGPTAAAGKGTRPVHHTRGRSPSLASRASARPWAGYPLLAPPAQRPDYPPELASATSFALVP